MDKKLNDFLQKLQKQIYEEARRTYGEAAFQRWLHPAYVGPIDDPDGYAILDGKCGDTMEVFLKFSKQRVSNASYKTDGCGASNICGSFAAEMAIGKTPDELLEITGEAIIDKLGGLPEAERHCAFLAAETLQEALNNYMIKESGKNGDHSPNK